MSDRTPVIIDQWGQPISSAEISLARAGLPRRGEEIAAPTMGSIRSVWTESVVAGLNPVSIAEVLRQAARGYPDRFFVLAEEMEERDMHYRSVLGTRRLAITGIEPIVVAASEDAADEKIAAAVRDLVAQPEFVDDYLTDLLDALAKGYALVETVWDRQAKEWWPAAYHWRDQRHFLIDQVDGRTLRLKVDGSAVGMDLPPFCFSVHRPKLKSGLPVRGGLARLAAWAFLFKNFTLKDWMQFLEVFGMPLRVGKFGPGASHDDKRILLQAVRDLSTDAAAIIPKAMEIEFLEVKGGSGNGLFGAMSEYLDKQVSKGVLGQTMSTDDGSSMSQAVVHENVRHDIIRADARQLAVTVNRDLVRPFVDFNYGPQDRYPTVVIPVTETEDIKALSEVVARLVPLGLKISESAMRERVGFDEPEDDEPVLTALAKAAPLEDPDEDDEDAGAKPPARKPAKKTPAAKDDPETARLKPVCPSCGKRHSLAAEQVDDGDEIDALLADALGPWERDMEPIFAPLKQLFERSRDYAELRAGLEDLAAKMDGGPLADRVAKLLMKGRGLGDLGL